MAVKKKSPAAKRPPAKPPEPKAKAPASGPSEGAKAPAFSLLDQDGQRVTSSAFAGKPYVIYFYPKDDTPGCTKEACDFRDSTAAFKKRAVAVLGVSPDSSASHLRFKGKYKLPFTLLSDPDKELCKAYGVWAKKQNYGREYMGVVRSTFLVDGRGVIRKAWRGLKVAGHVESVLGEAGVL
jgi:peroxiredoxin Q/BCP